MLNKGLHWSTVASEKVLLAGIGGLTLLASGEYMYGMTERSDTRSNFCSKLPQNEEVGIRALRDLLKVPLALPLKVVNAESGFVQEM